MHKTKRPLNQTGVWLANELARRGIQWQDFAKAIGCSPTWLSTMMHEPETPKNKDLLLRWEMRARGALFEMDYGETR